MQNKYLVSYELLRILRRNNSALIEQTGDLRRIVRNSVFPTTRKIETLREYSKINEEAIEALQQINRTVAGEIYDFDSRLRSLVAMVREDVTDEFINSHKHLKTALEEAEGLIEAYDADSR